MLIEYVVNIFDEKIIYFEKMNISEIFEKLIKFLAINKLQEQQLDSD